MHANKKKPSPKKNRSKSRRETLKRMYNEKLEAEKKMEDMNLEVIRLRCCHDENERLATEVQNYKTLLGRLEEDNVALVSQIEQYKQITEQLGMTAEDEALQVTAREQYV
ncbi:hypothetical protein FOZ61_004169 [Perkinsus olseni]|uniref:Uncharacterized protein n=1 Tax=Perkinsus olseni TaxID=32597 RepID=A0A7J6KLH2_PEROL|nr:hypothetical protein FOZ61_004169 [Perkinsus olseni]